MGLKKYKIGAFVEPFSKSCEIPNLTVNEVSGINRDKEFFEPSKQVGANTSKYKVVPPNYFACNLMHVGRDVVLPIALNHSGKDKEIMNYVNSLNETAEFWYYTYYPSQCNTISDEEQVWIEKLNHIGIGYFRPLVAVSLIPRLKITNEQRIAFFKAVERFIFINFRMAMYQSSYKSSDYYRKTREVYTEAQTLDAITHDLNNTTDSNAKDAIKVFITRMNRRFISADGFYSWRDLRYFLFEYEYTLATKYKLEKLSWALLTKVVK